MNAEPRPNPEANMRQFFLLAPALLIGGAALAQSQPSSPDPGRVQSGNYVIDPSHTRVQFTVNHLGFTHFNGDFTSVAGTMALDPANPTATRLTITMPTASITTNNGVLDKELRGSNGFDAEHFPEVRFVATKIVQVDASRATITGNLTMHGVTQPVTLDASFNGAGVNPLNGAYTVGFDASTTINRSQFGVKAWIPLVSDRTAIHISAAFEKKKA
jgi:polyisoprenoid-binding protein YceI